MGLLVLIKGSAGHVTAREDWKALLGQLQELAGMRPAASRPALEALAYLVHRPARGRARARAGGGLEVRGRGKGRVCNKWVS